MAETRTAVLACRRAAGDVPGSRSLTCAGRVSAEMLVGEIAGGADGVAVLACGADRHGCRFESGCAHARSIVARGRAVLGRLGMRPERVSVVDSVEALDRFRLSVGSLGPVGLAASPRPAAPPGLDGTLSWLAALMADPGLFPRRTGAVAAPLGRGERAETVFLDGCVHLAESIVGEGLRIAPVDDGVRLLRAAGFDARVLPDERCCGAPLLAAGDPRFRALAELNVARLRETGARRIVTRCSECARTLARDYAAAGFALDADVVPLGAVLAAAGMRFRPMRAARLPSCVDAADDPAPALFPGLPVAGRRPVHGPRRWLDGPSTRRAVDAVLAAAAKRGAERLVSACPRCALVCRLLSRDGSWRPTSAPTVSLCDMTPDEPEAPP